MPRSCAAGWVNEPACPPRFASRAGARDGGRASAPRCASSSLVRQHRLVVHYAARIEAGTRELAVSGAELEARIHSAPAESRLRTDPAPAGMGSHQSSASPLLFGAKLLELRPHCREPALEDADDPVANLGVLQQVKPPGGAAAISSARPPSPKSSSERTRRWRKTDSNLWFRISGKRFFYTASEPQTGREPQPVLTTDNGRFTVGRARLAPAMITTPGHRASRRSWSAGPNRKDGGSISAPCCSAITIRTQS